MKILGNRVYLIMPILKDYSITVDPKTQRELQEEELEKFEKLEVFGIGEGIIANGTLKVGDFVFVDPMGLKKGYPIKVNNQQVLVVNYYDILHVY